MQSDVAQYVALTPKDKITFAVGNQLSTLIINNNSPTKNIVYKIRTTQPLCYVVKPNSGIIEAMNEAKIEINYVPNSVSVESICSLIGLEFSLQSKFRPNDDNLPFLLITGRHKRF